jgi:aryl-alcohol dehydrogenase-like predicted oxidoreductase
MVHRTTFKKLVVGTAGLGGIWGPVDFRESVDAILYALEMGVVSFDTAPAYNVAEEVLGKALSEWKGNKPLVSTKAGRLKSERSDNNLYDYSPDALKQSAYNSLDTLGVDCLDILFLHDPSGLNPGETNKAINALVSLKDEGVIKSIGIGGNFSDDFHPFIQNKVFDVFMGYNRFNAICRDALTDEFKFIMTQNIAIWQASPLYMGLLGSKFNSYTSEKPTWIPEAHILKAGLLKKCGEKRNMSLPEISLRYLHAIPEINSIVVGAATMSELENTLTYWSKGKLEDEIIGEINQL